MTEPSFINTHENRYSSEKEIFYLKTTKMENETM